jgi:hypothetical protein
MRCALPLTRIRRTGTPMKNGTAGRTPAAAELRPVSGVGP